MRVWRYIDFPKLVWALTQDALVLTRVDTLDDKREGRHGKYLYEAAVQFEMRQLEAEGVPADHGERHRRANLFGEMIWRNEELTRAISFVSCWCKGGESEAMWRIYGGRGASVALALPYERLRDSLDGDRLYVGTVTYFDFNRGVLPPDNVFRPIMFKGHEYIYEDEVRIATFDPTLWEDDGAGGGRRPRPDRPNVVTVPSAIRDHVEKIVISPYAARWQADAIRAVVGRLSPGLESRIFDSEMT